MTTRDALHQLVDELPEGKAELRTRGFWTSATQPMRLGHRSTPTRLPLWIVVSRILRQAE